MYDGTVTAITFQKKEIPHMGFRQGTHCNFIILLRQLQVNHEQELPGNGETVSESESDDPEQYVGVESFL